MYDKSGQRVAFRHKTLWSTEIGKCRHVFNLLLLYCAGDKIEKNEMGWACGAYGRGEGGV